MSSTAAPSAAAREHGRGRRAETPRGISWDGWKDILWRTYAEFNSDRVTLIAAGATFFLLLALFPALAAFVSIYGFVADPVTIADHIAFLGGVLPSGGVDLIKQQLQSLTSQDASSLSFGFIFGLLLALWSANSGIKTLFEAMNIAYDETEKRSFMKLNLLSLLFTLGAIVIAILFIVSVGVVPAVLAFVGLGSAAETLISLARWPVLFAASVFAVAILYRYGPSRERAKWRWVTWGSVVATAVWILASILFSWYLQNFADYNATYGSLGAVIGFMMWTWISVTILIVGAELNSEMEHQTARDTTTGAPQPMGARGASMADTLGERTDKSGTEAKAKREQNKPLTFPGEASAADKDTRPRRAERPSKAAAIAALTLPLAAMALRRIRRPRGAGT